MPFRCLVVPGMVCMVVLTLVADPVSSSAVLYEWSSLTADFHGNLRLAMASGKTHHQLLVGKVDSE